MSGREARRPVCPSLLSVSAPWFFPTTCESSIFLPTYIRSSTRPSKMANLDLDVANAVAHAMKSWAIEHGATHYAHWFQPLSGITSEKHDSFL